MCGQVQPFNWRLVRVGPIRRHFAQTRLAGAGAALVQAALGATMSRRVGRGAVMVKREMSEEDLGLVLFQGPIVSRS